MRRKPRVAINGFGRIGRLFFRQAHKKFQIAAINDLGDPETLAYLLKYDTVYRLFDYNLKQAVERGRIKYLQEKNPAALPWAELKIDIVVEATGIFESFAEAQPHLRAGAKRVVITAPAKDAERGDAKTILLGVNEQEFKHCTITSNGSCTTNAAHPVAAIMSETVGVKKASMNTIHGYTATQALVDGTAGRSKDLRRGRAAAVNIVPSNSGATNSVIRALPNLEGKFDGIAARVPLITGSLIDFTFVAERDTSVEEVNDIFRKAAQEKRWREIMTVVEEPIVSSDVIGQPYGAIIDLNLTKVIDGDLVKVFSWYDNEWGYVTTLVKHVEKVAQGL